MTPLGHPAAASLPCSSTTSAGKAKMRASSQHENAARKEIFQGFCSFFLCARVTGHGRVTGGPHRAPRHREEARCLLKHARERPDADFRSCALGFCLLDADVGQRRLRLRWKYAQLLTTTISPRRSRGVVGMMDGGTVDVAVLQLAAECAADALDWAFGLEFEHCAKSGCLASPSACWVLRGAALAATACG